MAARVQLRAAVQNLKKHFTGRAGTPTANVAPYVEHLVAACKTGASLPEPAAASKLEDLRAYSQYLEAMVNRKKILSRFGGDEVRGISPAVRNSNTAMRCGLGMPKLSIQDDAPEPAPKSSLRDDLEGIAQTRK